MLEQEQNSTIYYQRIILNLENAVKTERFESKEQLNKYMNDLIEKNRIPETYLSPETRKRLLNLYDEHHQKDQASLDMDNFKESNLDTQATIINKQEDIILKNNDKDKELIDQFKEIQNQMSSMTVDGLANANIVFDNIKDNKKEQINFLSISEAINRENIDKEILNKIKFLISNKTINLYSYKVDIDSGIFYNEETKEVYEVIKNEQGQYEIKKGAEVVYNGEEPEEHVEKQISNSEEEMIEYNESKNYQQANVKVRRLIPQSNNNKAFIRSSLLVFGIMIFSIILSILLIKLI